MCWWDVKSGSAHILLWEDPRSIREAWRRILVGDNARPNCAHVTNPNYSRTSVTQHWWRVYHGCFELVIESLGKSPIAADLGQFRVIFFFYVENLYCVYSLESPQWGDSNENTQHTFILKKIEKISLLRLLTWCYKYHSLARTTPVSNIFPWSQRCSSHWSSTVHIERETFKRMDCISFL